MTALKAGDRRMVEIHRYSEGGGDWMIVSPDGSLTAWVREELLHPLPDAALPTSVEAVLTAAREQERIYASSGPDFSYSAACHTTDAAIRAHEQKEGADLDCPHKNVLLAGCCGKTPCTRTSAAIRAHQETMMEKPQFQVGQRVRVKDTCDCPELRGRTGTIHRIADSGWLTVDLSGKEDLSVAFVLPQHIELIEITPVEAATLDLPALYDAGQCCGKTPCAVVRPVGAPCLATPDFPALERAVAEIADKCVTADGVLYVRGTLFDDTYLAKAVMALRAARKPPDAMADVTKLLTAILQRADKSHTGCNPQLLGDDVSALARAALAAMPGVA